MAGCGCGGSVWQPPGAAEAQQSQGTPNQTATQGAPPPPTAPQGPGAPGYTWNGPTA